MNLGMLTAQCNCLNYGMATVQKEEDFSKRAMEGSVL